MAPVASRFQTFISKEPCGTIMHPWCPESCCKGSVEIMRAAAFNTLPFALLFYLAKLGIRLYTTGDARLEVKLLPSRILRTTLFAVLLSGGFVTTACLLRRLLGEFRVLTLAFVPGCVGGLAILSQYDRDLRFFLDTFFVTAVEYCIRLVAIKDGTGRLQGRNLHRKETLLFAILSSLLALLQRTDKSGAHIPWFHWPDQKSSVKTNTMHCRQEKRSVWPLQWLLLQRHVACKHHGACAHYVALGCVKYAALGAALSILQDVIPRARAFLVRKSHVQNRFFSPSLPAFFASYVTAFRSFRCLLCWALNEDVSSHSMIAGLMAGFCYTLHPSYSVFAAALASVLELTWRRLVEHDGTPNCLRSRPRLVCALSLGLIMHAYATESVEICPPAAALFIGPCSGGRASEMVAALRKTLGTK